MPEGDDDVHKIMNASVQLKLSIRAVQRIIMSSFRLPTYDDEIELIYGVLRETLNLSCVLFPWSLDCFCIRPSVYLQDGVIVK